VTDCLTRQYEEVPNEEKFSGLMLQHLPAAFQSIREHQLKEPYCVELRQKVDTSDPTARHFKLHNDTLVYFPSKAKGKRYVVPESLKPMIFEYFHDSTWGAHLGMTKTLRRISNVFYWLGMRADILDGEEVPSFPKSEARSEYSSRTTS
jgi:hypothetical protein